MTRYAIDAEVAVRLIRDRSDADRRHELVGPAVLRSQVMSILFRQVRIGGLNPAEGRQHLEHLAGMKIRLLGDRVSRSTAWRIAERLGWDDIGPAEYLAVATLQADFLVTENARLLSAADGIIAIADYASLAA